MSNLNFGSASWMNQTKKLNRLPGWKISELILRKRAENEMLKKLGGMVVNSDSEKDELFDASAEIRKEQKK